MTDVRDDLFAAVRARDRQRVREILQQRPESAMARDPEGATALHYATEHGDRAIVAMLLDAGADMNARDLRFEATPAGWAIEYLRQRGGLLGIEIEDTSLAIVHGDEHLVRRYLSRFPALRDALDRTGTPLKMYAENSGNGQIARLFDAST
ncbi:MAG TPA: ankyrin repeat domain-containing protein [Thermoanaerobaculia bacterium]|jgi:hypothetical protein